MGLLEGKVAIVTGAGRGIGRGIAHAFANEGANVAIVDINKESAESVADELPELGAKGLGIACDVRDRNQVNACVKAAIDEFGQLDILVNAAIAGAPVVPLMDTTAEMMNLMYESGPLGTFFMMQEAYPHMKGRNAKIINFASAAGIIGGPGYGAYAPAKEAVRSLSKVAANEWGVDGIRVNVVCPHANSPLQKEWEAQFPDRAAEVYATIPLRRVGDCKDDVGEAVVFLASDLSSYITGHTLMVDGGRHML